jgi:hypothetical protein
MRSRDGMFASLECSPRGNASHVITARAFPQGETVAA